VDDATRPAYSLIKDVASVIRVDEAKVWSETVVDRLAELRPDAYGEWTHLDGRAKGNRLASALKPFGVETLQVSARRTTARPPTGAVSSATPCWPPRTLPTDRNCSTESNQCGVLAIVGPLASPDARSSVHASAPHPH
jgi:hypothetical protein